MKPSNNLGYIVWHTVPSNKKFSLEKIKELKNEHHLYLILPDRPSKANVFRRVAKEFEEKFVEEDATIKVYLESASENKKEIVKNIVAEITRKNDTEKKKNKEVIGNVTFDKKNETSTFHVNSEFLTHSATISYAFNQFTEYNKDKIDNLAVRGMVRNLLEEVFDSLWLKSGTYFVAEKYYDELVSLKDFNSKIGCEFAILPALDDDLTKTVLKNAVELNFFKASHEFYKLFNTLKNSKDSLTAKDYEKLEALQKRALKFRNKGLELALVAFHPAVQSNVSDMQSKMGAL